MYNFDKQQNRRGSNSLKWEYMSYFFPSNNFLPYWVADMDFATLPEVTEALLKRAKHPLYGYAGTPAAYYQSFIDWFSRRHNYKMEKDWLCETPGIVPALHLLVQAFTEPKERVAVQTPVYHPFYSAVEKNGRELVKNPLLQKDNRYYMDFAGLEQEFKKGVKMFLLCSPHNPVGRVWEKEELHRLAELCLQYNVLVVTDEIHADFCHFGTQHTVFASLSESIARQSIVCLSPGKTFNLAGLQVAFLSIANPTLKERFDAFYGTFGFSKANIFALEAVIAAYTYGDTWVNELNTYLENNKRILSDFCRLYLPCIEPVFCEGTYLVWLDCRKFGLEATALEKLFLDASLALQPGRLFGREGEGYQRMNIACPASFLLKGLRLLKKSLTKKYPAAFL